MNAKELKPCCPQCSAPLKEVRQSPDSMLNAEQFDAAKLGDWFCSSCAPQGESYRYFWNRELSVAAPSDAAQAPVCWIEKEQLEQVRDESFDAWVYWRETGHVAESDEVPLYAAPVAPAAAAQPDQRWASLSAALVAINKLIRHGDLQEPSHSERNGLVLAYNAVCALLDATGDERRLAKSHCQNGGDVCLAGNRDGVCCPEDSCDIDDGVRTAPFANCSFRHCDLPGQCKAEGACHHPARVTLPQAGAHPNKRTAFEAWAKPRSYDLTRCSPEAYAAYKSDLTEGAWSGWLAASQLSTETVDKPVQRMSDAERDVRAERARQLTVEGWTPNHDDHHDEGQLAAVAGYYALACSFPHSRDLGRGQIPAYWPWDKSWWKPTSARRNLVKAGALIIAEIERIDRADSAVAQDGAQ